MYVRYSLVDSKTSISVDVEPAYNGPKIPDGISYIYRDSNNSLYGFVENSFESVYPEIDKEHLLALIKSEHLATLKIKKDYLLSNFQFQEIKLSVKEVMGCENLSFPRYFDFNSEVILLEKYKYEELFIKVKDYEQEVLHWFYEFNKEINQFEEVEPLIEFFEKNIYIDFIGDPDVS